VVAGEEEDYMATAEQLPGGDTRRRLIDAAIEVFLERGYAGTRVQDIARRAGLTTGAMYSHFENKAALLSEAIAVSGDTVLRELLDAMSNERTKNGVALGVNMLSGPSTPGHRLMLEALAGAARGDETAEIIVPTLTRMRQVFSDNVAAAREHGRLDESITDDVLVSVFERFILGSIVAKALDLPTGSSDESERLMTTFFLSLLPHASPDIA
jgi:AcrR family transcriptional regulator